MTRYQGPIVDAHHHFWEPELGRQPWLLPEARIPFRYGDYEAIKRSYLPPDLLKDAAGFNIVGTVTMETEWDLDDPIGEMEYTQHIQDTYGLPSAAAAHVVLDDPGVGRVLEQLASMPIVRSVRHKPGQAPRPRDAHANPSKLMDPGWRRGYALLVKSGLHFELQVAWWHMHEAVDLARAFPDEVIIINHCGLPSDRTPPGLGGWRAAMSEVAACPNAVVKISGIGLQGVPWLVENNRPIVDTLASLFGRDRIMFASNFPVDSLCGTYEEIFGGFVEISKDWSPSEQEAGFIGNAVRIYSLDEELLRR